VRTVPVKRASEGREHAPISPVVPAAGVVLLALLWVLSAFAGWATAAFCPDPSLAGACQDQVTAAVRPSAAVAAVAAALAGVALMAPLAMKSVPAARAARLWLLVASVAGWVLALAVLFVAGEVASA
jgi:hypothetical protein